MSKHRKTMNIGGWFSAIAVAATCVAHASSLEVSSSRTISNTGELEGVTEITLSNKAVLTFDLSSDFSFAGKISGTGSVVKNGVGALSLTSTGAKDYQTSEGWTVNAGKLVLPQFDSGNPYCEYGSITVNAPGVLVLGGHSMTVVRGLYGDGLVTNINSGATLDVFGGDFSGKIQGTMAFRSDDNTFNLRGVENSFGSFVNLYGGRLGVARFGMIADALSSIGSSNGNSFYGAVNLRGDVLVEYLGDVDDVTDKTIHLLNVPTRAGIDGGAHGGMTFSGTWNVHREAGTKAVQSLLLTGSNAVNPCVFSGPFTESTRTIKGATYITKRGTGTWRFTDNANRKNRGTIAVEEGTLQFTSIAETNVVCSLGLATQCATEYSAVDWDESKRVDYAYLLGTSSTVGTMEYIGGTDGYVTTRKIALKGDGRLMNSGDGTLDWTGVKTLDSTTNTLYLSGSGDGFMKAVDEGTAKLSIMKEGAGTWSAAGVKASGGLAVKGGTFRLKSNRYRYFRWTIKNMSGSAGVIYITEFALYDASGNRLNVNPTIVQKGTDASQLQPNEACFEESRAMDGNGTTTETGSNLSKLFDNGNSYAIMQTAFRTAPNGTASTYLPIVMRLAADSPEVASYDIKGGEKDIAVARGLSAWMLEGSIDGKAWHLLDDVSGFTPPSASNWQWYKSNNGGVRFATSETCDEALANAWMLDYLEVAPGARFESEETITANGLSIDASCGGGVVSNVVFGAGGLLRVSNMPQGGQPNLDMTYIDVTGLDVNVGTWTVEVDGLMKPNWHARFRNGQLELGRPGMVILVK
jgi:hypothetical protein